MNGFGVISFDELFAVKVTPVNADRVLGYDSEGNVNAAFTLQSLRTLLGGGDWNGLSNKPEVFPAAPHTLSSHTDTAGLAAATDGKYLAKVAGKWRAVTPDFARPGDIPNVPSWVLQISEGEKSNWNTAFAWGNHAGQYRPVAWVPGWSEVTGKPSTFAPAPHVLSSHSDASALASATAGQLVRRGATGFEAFTADYYSPLNPPPPDPTIDDALRSVTIGNISIWNAKAGEYASFPMGAIPTVRDGAIEDSLMRAVYSENPYEVTDPLYDPNWEPEVIGYTVTKPVKGVDGVEEDDFVSKRQLNNVASDLEGYVSFAENQSSKTETERQTARDNMEVYSKEEVDETTGELDNLNTADKANLVIAINQKGQYQSINW